MPVTFRILKEHALVHVRSSGVLKMDEQTASFQEYSRHPDFAPGQKYLIDLRLVTRFDGDYTAAMQLHANMSERIPSVEASVMFVYLADTEGSQKLSRVAVNAFAASKNIVACVAATEREALEILGLPATSLQALQDVQSNLSTGDAE